MSIQNLREQRAAKAKSLSEIVSKADWKPEVDQPIYDAGMLEIDAIDAQIKRVNDVNAKVAEDALKENVIVAAERIGKDKKSRDNELYAKWLRGGDNAINSEDWSYIRNTMSTTTTTEGGYTVQSNVAATLIDALKEYGGMRATSTILQTAQGNPLSFPTSDGTSEVGEWIAQNVTATGADPSFGTVALNVFKASSKIVAVPYELLQDSTIDIEAFVAGRLAARLGRITNTGYTVGTGSGQPNGIVTAASTGVTAANSSSQVTAITYDSIIDLIHSVDPAYRARRCTFMMNDASVKVIRKVKDGQSRPLFVPGYEVGVPGGAPDTLCGYPIVVNQDVAVMAASAKSVVFGDLASYYIRDAMEVTLFRFTDSAYTKLGQVGFLGWMRTGGNLLDTAAVKLFVNAAS
jgi:HK97 family phage major capsid protein